MVAFALRTFHTSDISCIMFFSVATSLEYTKLKRERQRTRETERQRDRDRQLQRKLDSETETMRTTKSLPSTN